MNPVIKKSVRAYLITGCRKGGAASKGEATVTPPEGRYMSGLAVTDDHVKLSGHQEEDGETPPQRERPQ